MLNTNCFIIILILLLSLVCQGQNTPSDTTGIDISSIRVIAERSEDAVTLRWAPSSPSLWLAANRHGYQIHRMVIDSNNYDTDLFVMLGSKQVTPKEEWEVVLKQEGLPKYMTVAAECIYAPFKSLEMGEGMGAWVAQSDELYHKFSFALFAADMDARTSDYSGLRFVDKRISPGMQYVYRVTANLPDDEQMAHSPGITFVDDQLTSYPAINLETEDAEGVVVLRWLRDSYFGKYTAYFIERAPKGGNFIRLNDEPFIHGQTKDKDLYNPFFVYQDSVKNYRAYEYRVVGISPFGNTGPAVGRYAAMGRDKTAPPKPEILDAKNTEGRSVEITWEYEGATDLEGFDIYRGHEFEDNYYKINKTRLSKNARSFTDASAMSLDLNYYYVNAVDTAGNVASSIIKYGLIEDTIPPSPPVGLEGEVDSNGVVTIKWTKNKEADILGYKIFYANADYHEFSLLTGQAIPTSSYQDTVTLKTLTRNAYYRVIAVDRRYNYSALSEILEVKRPDTIPPTSPLFTEYKVDKHAISLEWANSHSNDLEKHVLYRRTGKGNWTVLKEFKEGENSFSDKMIEEGKFYSYKILAVDEAGLFSKAANPLVLQAVNIILKPGIKKLLLNNSREKEVALNWSYPIEGKYRFVVYRAEGDTGFELLKVLRSDKKDFVDKRVRDGKSYRYTVQVEFSDGTHSEFSPIVYN